MRREIADTRGELSQTIQALEVRIEEVRESVVDKVSPKRVLQRKTAEVRQRLDDMGAAITGSTQAMTGSIKDAKATLADKSSMTTERTGDLMGRTKSKIRGQAQEVSERAEEMASGTGSQAKAAPAALRQRTESNPMAAGLVALGAGFLVAALLPPTDRERQAASRVQTRLEPVKKQVTQVGKDIAGELQQSAQGSVEQLKERATSAVGQVKQDAQSSTEVVKDEAQDATTQVKRRTRSASQEVKKTASEGSGTARPRSPRSPRAAGRQTSRRAPVSASAP
ncbi:MAG: hypothetical protein KY447_05815 [Actinobacteria bacterium]|nr:hypothetical protein [Actinomycetota bacterium]MBW3642414.1 hypothetical protein [Actinomycetota bacterium]